jgi:hypothetical protein
MISKILYAGLPTALLYAVAALAQYFAVCAFI